HVLASLVLPAGMRVVLYRNIEAEISHREFVDASGVVAESAALEPLVARVRETRAEARQVVQGLYDVDSVTAVPLPARGGAVLGVLLISSSGREAAALVNRIRWSGAAFVALGIVFGCALAYVVAARIVRPVEQLAEASREVAAGHWHVQLAATRAP